MFDNLIKYINEVSPEDLAGIEIEEMAIASAWCESHNGASAISAKYPEIPEKIEWWLENNGASAGPTEGRRLQPLLREVLDRAVEEGVEKLHRNELDLLDHAYSLIERAQSADKFERLIKYFDRQIDGIRDARKRLAPIPGLPGLDEFLRVVVPEEILQSPRRSVSTFAGVRLPGRGPLLHHRGNLKVMGYVPDDCMVVVEEGNCLIHGYVFGRVAATYDCEVRDNVAGDVISSLGDIRARNILTNAFVVSKWGETVVRRTESPKLVFGGKLIRIREDADGGRYASPEILVEGIVRSGEFSVSRVLSATEFQQSDTRQLFVVLRRTISPEDYGGLVDPLAARLLSAIRRKRQRRDSWTGMINLAEDETKQFARNALHFLTGGNELLEGLQSIGAQERRLSLSIRIISALDSISLMVENQIASIADTGSSPDEVVRDSTLIIRDLKRELTEIYQSDKRDDDLSEYLGELDEIVQELEEAESAKKLSTSFLFELQARTDAWEEQRGELIETLSKKMAAVEQLLGESDLRKRGEQLSEVTVLARVLNAAAKRPSRDTLFKRAHSNFVTLMLRSIELRKERIKHYEKMVEGIAVELDELGDRLERDAKIPVPPEWPAQLDPPRAEGVFGPGVTICTERYMVNDVQAPPGARFVTDGRSREPITLTRKHNRIGIERDPDNQASP